MSRYMNRAVNKRKRKTRVRTRVGADPAATTTSTAPAPIADARHCDDYIDDESQPDALRLWLSWARAPAHGYTAPKPWPVLFADWVDRGGIVQLTMASHFGDVGVTRDLSADPGPYEDRVYLDLLTNFRGTRD